MHILDFIHNLLGIHSEKLLIWHMIWRSLVVYVLGIVLARFNKRFMAFRTVNNFFLFIFIGSVLASSIVGNLFYETLGMAIFVIFINWLVVVVEYYSTTLKFIIQGKPIILIDNGVIQRKNLNKLFISEADLIAILRVRMNITDIQKVEKSYFENIGQISFVIKN